MLESKVTGLTIIHPGDKMIIRMASKLSPEAQNDFVRMLHEFLTRGYFLLLDESSEVFILRKPLEGQDPLAIHVAVAILNEDYPKDQLTPLKDLMNKFLEEQESKSGNTLG